MPSGGDFYSPQKVEYLLAHVNDLLTNLNPRTDDPITMRGNRRSKSGWLEEQMAKQADILRALEWLGQQERAGHIAPNTYRVVYLCGVGGKDLREAAAIVGVSYRTVRRRRTNGIRAMAGFLGWEG